MRAKRLTLKDLVEDFHKHPLCRSCDAQRRQGCARCSEEGARKAYPEPPPSQALRGMPPPPPWEEASTPQASTSSRETPPPLMAPIYSPPPPTPRQLSTPFPYPPLLSYPSPWPWSSPPRPSSPPPLPHSAPPSPAFQPSMAPAALPPAPTPRQRRVGNRQARAGTDSEASEMRASGSQTKSQAPSLHLDATASTQEGSGTFKNRKPTSSRFQIPSSMTNEFKVTVPKVIRRRSKPYDGPIEPIWEETTTKFAAECVTSDLRFQDIQGFKSYEETILEAKRRKHGGLIPGEDPFRITMPSDHAKVRPVVRRPRKRKDK